jgi:hypothetical protein
MSWLGKALKSMKKAVKVVGTPIKLAAKAGRTIGKTLGKVPVIGGGLKGVFDLTANGPFQIAGHIASGERLDKVALGAIKDHVASVKAVAPYAQTVIGLVPAIGPGINAGIGASLALASGQPISQAIMEGAKAMLPGGPLAKQIFSATQAVVQGKSLSNIALAALPLDAQSKKGIGMALDVTSHLAKGERVDKILISQADDAMKLLPGDIKKALQISTALSHAQNLQKIALQHVRVPALANLKAGGMNLIKASPVLVSAGHVLKTSASRDGYALAVGALAHSRPQPFHLAAIRAKIGPQQMQGFDLAVAAHVGMARTRPALVIGMTPAQKLGFFTTQGISKTSTAPALIKAVKTNPLTAPGVNAAALHIQAVKQGLWKRIKAFLLST